MDELRAALELYFPDKTWHVERLEWYPYVSAIQIQNTDAPLFCRAGLIVNEETWNECPELTMRKKIVPALWAGMRYPQITFGNTVIRPPIVILGGDFFSDDYLIGDSWGHTLVYPFALAAALIREYGELPVHRIPWLECRIPRPGREPYLLRLTHYVAPGVGNLWCGFDPMQRTWYKRVMEG